eukprot:Gb_25903 [translate_table: standard]
MEERNSFRLGDEISEFNSLNLRDLMKEQDEDEIREIAAEDECRERQTMGSILTRRIRYETSEDASQTLWEVIQSEQSKAWERPFKCKEVSTSRLLKNVCRLVSKKRDEERLRLEEESYSLLEGWGAERSPSVVDSARLQAADEARNQRFSHFEGAVRVFLVGGSNPTLGQIMDGANRTRWKALKEKLKLRNIACCGSSWSGLGAERSNLNSTPVVLPAREDDEISWNSHAELENSDPAATGPEVEPPPPPQIERESPLEVSGNNRDESCVNLEPPRVSNLAEENSESNGTQRRQLMTFFDRRLEGSNESLSGSIRVSMNLAAALAAERQLRATQDWDSIESRPSNVVSEVSSAAEEAESTRGTPFRVSLMSLLEEADERNGGHTVNMQSADTTSLLTGGLDAKYAMEEPNEGLDPLCCVCMVRRKGAAFIPCGHTFCRLCTRELWVSRGSCPLCNRCIMEILDIF